MKPYWQQVLESDMPQQAKGKTLDQLAVQWDVKRKTYFWIFKESDKKFRARLLKLMRGITNE